MPEHEPGSPPSPASAPSAEERLAALERSVAALTGELAALRRDLGAARNGATPAEASRDARLRDLLSRPPADPPRHAEARDPRPSMARRLEAADVESLVGRYGTLVLATITGLAALGTFLGWAIARGMLGPSVRVVLGLVAAAALAVAGFRLRRRERAFGSALLGIALAVAQVCAWAAGPSLGLVPQWVALGLAAAASVALALFAHAVDDEPLWCAGFAGASIAPFVTASEPGHALALFGYALVVLGAGAYALGGRTWRVAGRVFMMSASLFTGALVALPEREKAPLLALALPFLVAVVGAIPFAERSVLRARLRGLGGLATIAAWRVALSLGLSLAPWQLGLILGGALVAWLFLIDRAADAEPGPLVHGVLDAGPAASLWLEGAWIPLGMAATLPLALADWAAGGLAVALATLAIGVALARRMARDTATAGAGPTPTMATDALAFAAAVCAVAATVLVGVGREAPLATLAGTAVVAVGLVLACGAFPSRSWLVVAGVTLGLALALVLVALTDRAAYAYPPFATRESAAAAAVVAALAAMAWLAPRTSRALGGGGDSAAVIQVRLAPWAAGFLWVHQEISWAISPTVATLLRVSYYAATSVAAVWVGRARGLPFLRHIGLGLAVLAGATALYESRRLEIAARIGAYLVVSVFLLGIAYWYRRPGSGEESVHEAASAAPSAAP